MNETNQQPVSLHGKVILITGATRGIGRATALKLAALGATIIAVGRSTARCQEVVEQIQRSAGTPADYLVADLASLRQVRQLADQFRGRFSRLDVLINNAGAYYAQRQLSPDGYELTFALNHLSYFLLTNLLLELLKNTAEQAGEARIVNVASQAHAGGKLNFEELQAERGYGRMGFDAYSNSKLANILFTFELAHRLQGTTVTANALHPGFVASAFGTNNSRIVSFLIKTIGFLALSPEEGAQTSIYLASSPAVRGVSGEYFIKCKPVRAAPQAYDLQARQKLWEISQQLVVNALE